MQVSVDYALAAKYLHEGKVIAYPTEAVYGLGCDPHNEDAVHKLIALKKRKVSQGLILLADKIERFAKLLSLLNLEQVERLKCYWQGYATVIVPDTSLPTHIRGEYASVALRVSNYAPCQKLCEAFGGYIVSTSANLSGAEELKHSWEIPAMFPEIDFILEAGVGSEMRPSPIYDLLTGNCLRK